MTAVSLGTMLSVIDGAIPNVALPTVARDLGVDNSAAVLVVTVYQLVLVMTLLPFSALGDRIGHKRLYQSGQLVFTIASLLCFFTHSLPFLLVVRALQALGAAAALSVVSVMLRSIYPTAKLGRALGINAVIISLSAAAAPTAGGLILAVASWPWVFAAAAPIGAASLLIGRWALPHTPGRDTPYNLAGALLSMATLGLGVGGLEALVHGNSPIVSLAIVAIAIGVGVGLVLHERREPVPILPIDLLGLPVIALSLAGTFVAFMGSMLVILSLPFRLEHGYGLPPSEIGAMIAPWPIAGMIVGPIAGFLSDRYPAGLLGGVGMGLATIGMVALAWLPASPDYVDVAWRMGLCGAGFGLFASPNARIVVGSAPRDRVAPAGGLLSTTRLTGQTLGATGVATLLALSLGTTSAPPLIGACLTVIAGCCSLARLRPSLRNPPSHETATASSTG